MLNKPSFKTHPTLLLPLDIAEVRVLNTHLNKNGDDIISVESMPTFSNCQHCGRKLTKLHSYGRAVELRPLSVLGYQTYIQLQPKQYKCRYCDDKLTTQRLD